MADAGKRSIRRVQDLKPYFAVRAVGGSMVVVGAYIQAYNIYKTVRSGQRIELFMQSAPAEVGS